MSSGNLLPTFWDNLSVPSSGFKNNNNNNNNNKKMGLLGCSETSGRNSLQAA